MSDGKPGHIRLFVGLTVLALLGLALIFIKSGVFKFYEVTSASMSPALEIGDYLAIRTTAYADRFDVVAFPDPNESETMLIKRVVGLGGDTIKIEAGILYVNGEAQYNASIVGNRVNWPNLYHKVPFDHYFVLGDNRNDSYDSLNFGPIRDTDIEGVLKFVYWPPGRWGADDPFKQANGGGAGDE